MNREFKSNEELFDAIRKLQNSVMISDNKDAAREIADGFSCLNGLTDGWTLLMEALEKVKIEHANKFNKAQEKDLEDIISCVKKVVYR